MEHEEIIDEILEFINTKVKELNNYSFRKVLEAVEIDLLDQLTALESMDDYLED